MYTDYLHYKEWQDKKTKILSRDNNKCQSARCKTPNSKLDVHHIEYLSFDLKPWEYPDDMLISLCRVCHSRENNRYAIEESLLTCLKMKGLLVSDLNAFIALMYSDKKFETNLIKSIRDIQNG